MTGFWLPGSACMPLMRYTRAIAVSWWRCAAPRSSESSWLTPPQPSRQCRSTATRKPKFTLANAGPATSSRAGYRSGADARRVRSWSPRLPCRHLGGTRRGTPECVGTDEYWFPILSNARFSGEQPEREDVLFPIDPLVLTRPGRNRVAITVSVSPQNSPTDCYRTGQPSAWFRTTGERVTTCGITYRRPILVSQTTVISDTEIHLRAHQLPATTIIPPHVPKRSKQRFLPFSSVVAIRCAISLPLN